MRRALVYIFLLLAVFPLVWSSHVIASPTQGSLDPARHDRAPLSSGLHHHQADRVSAMGPPSAAKKAAAPLPAKKKHGVPASPAVPSNLKKPTAATSVKAKPAKPASASAAPRPRFNIALFKTKWNAAVQQVLKNPQLQQYIQRAHQLNAETSQLSLQGLDQTYQIGQQLYSALQSLQSEGQQLQLVNDLVNDPAGTLCSQTLNAVMSQMNVPSGSQPFMDLISSLLNTACTALLNNEDAEAFQGDIESSLKEWISSTVKNSVESIVPDFLRQPLEDLNTEMQTLRASVNDEQNAAAEIPEASDTPSSPSPDVDENSNSAATPEVTSDSGFGFTDGL